MTHSNQGTPEDGSDGVGDVDRQWLDGLAGRVPVEGASAPARDAALLRKHLLARHAEELSADEERTAADPGEHERDWHRFRFAAQSAGAPSGRKTAVLDWGWQRPGGIAAVMVLGVAIGVSMLRNEGPKYDEPTVLMGDNAVQHITDAAPQAKAEAIAAQLQTAGITTRIYQRKTVFFVDIEVLPERLEEFDAVLRSVGVTPKPGLVRLQIDKP